MKTAIRKLGINSWILEIRNHEDELIFEIWAAKEIELINVTDKFTSALQSHVQAELSKMLDEWTDKKIDNLYKLDPDRFMFAADEEFNKLQKAKRKAIKWFRDQIRNKLK